MLTSCEVLAVCGDGCTPPGDFGIRSFEGELSSNRQS